jgi:periplasmic protein TonB
MAMGASSAVEFFARSLSAAAFEPREQGGRMQVAKLNTDFRTLLHLLKLLPGRYSNQSRARGATVCDVQGRMVMTFARPWLLVGVLFLAGAAHAEHTPVAYQPDTDAVAMLGGGLEKPEPSAATSLQAYRKEAARHIYKNFPELVHHGLLPARLHTVAIIETTIDADGTVEKIEVVREPSAKAATPFILGMIQGAQPYPAAPQLGSKVVYRDIWLIAQGRFQLDAITEGQESSPSALARVQ